MAVVKEKLNSYFKLCHNVQFLVSNSLNSPTTFLFVTRLVTFLPTTFFPLPRLHPLKKVLQVFKHICVLLKTPCLQICWHILLILQPKMKHWIIMLNAREVWLIIFEESRFRNEYLNEVFTFGLLLRSWPPAISNKFSQCLLSISISQVLGI